MHLEMRVTREGLRVNDPLRPCRGLHSGRYMGLTEHGTQPVNEWLGSSAEEGRAKLR